MSAAPPPPAITLNSLTSAGGDVETSARQTLLSANLALRLSW